MVSSKKVKNFAVSIIKIAEKHGLSEEEFTSAIDTARKVIRRNPVSAKCLDDVHFEPNELFGEIGTGGKHGRSNFEVEQERPGADGF